MCLAVPMRIVEVLDPPRAVAERGCERLDIDVSLLERVEPGDYVIVHAGYALETVESEDAEERIALLDGSQQ